MIEPIEIEGDLIRYNGRIIARMSPDLSLGTVRSLEEYLIAGHPRRLVEMQEDAQEKADAKHEMRASIADIEQALLDAIEPILMHNAGLVTRDDVKAAYKKAIDELGEPFD